MVYHLLGEGVLEDGRYVEFMGGFGEGVVVSFNLVALSVPAVMILLSSSSYCPRLHASHWYRH